MAESLDYICAERLTPALAPTARLLVAHGELTVSEAVFEKLSRISIATVGRILRRLRQGERRLPRRGPERAAHILSEIPARASPGTSGSRGTSGWIWSTTVGRVPAVSICTRSR